MHLMQQNIASNNHNLVRNTVQSHKSQFVNCSILHNTYQQKFHEIIAEMLQNHIAFCPDNQ